MILAYYTTKDHIGITTMANDNSISSVIESFGSVYGNKDIDWVRFVHDHYYNIFSTCTSYNLDKSSHYWRYYRLEDYLREINVDPNIAWIVLLVNQMSSRKEFKDLDNILIPDMYVLRGLRQSFMQYRSHLKAIR